MTATPTRETTARGARFVLVAMTTTMVLLVLDSSIVGVMLPSMRRELALSPAAQAWIVTSYLLSLAVLLPIGGKLADAVGPVRMFLIGMTGFALASLGIATAQGPASLIAWRSVAGAAAALLMPATMAILTGTFPGPSRAKAMAVYLGVGQGFSTIGPAIGGVCAEFVSWRLGFLVNVPVCLVGVLLTVKAKPDNSHTRPRSWDPVGAGLVIVGVTALVLALLQGPGWGWAAPATLGAAVVGVSCLAVFVVSSLRSGESILDLRLFADRSFAVGSGVLFAVGFVVTAATVYGAVALQDSLDLPPAASGLALLPLVVPLLAATRWISGRYDALGPRRIGALGGLSLTVGLAVIAVGLGLDSLAVACAGMVFTGVGIGLLMSPLTTATLSAAPGDRRGQAAGLVSTCRQLGGIIGVGVFSACVAAAPGAPGAHVVPGVVLGFGIATAVMLLAALLCLCLPRPQVPTRPENSGRDRT